MNSFEEKQQKELESLNFFRMLITKYPQEFVKNMRTCNIMERARVLAFLQVRDKEIFEQAQELLKGV